jgi:hypothetical protein
MELPFNIDIIKFKYIIYSQVGGVKKNHISFKEGLLNI